MALTSGFFDSLNGDRKYNAEQLSAIFDGIINDGIFASIGDNFVVKAVGGNNITVGTGRAWFNSTWIYNDALLPLTLTDSDVLLDRYDCVAIEVNHNTSVRNASIKIIKGAASNTPSYPKLTNSELVHQYPLAYIYRTAGSTSITQVKIVNRVGTTSCPFVTGILTVLSIDSIVAQWEAEWGVKLGEFDEALLQSVDAWNRWRTQQQTDVEDFMNTLQDTLDENAEVKLANRVVSVESLLSAPEMHRTIFRGKNLGVGVTDAQLAAIQNATFEDLYLGDYWEINGNYWRIVDFDYWYGTGNSAPKCTKHHVVIMPDKYLYKGSMNSSSTTAGGYFNSNGFVNGITTYIPIIKAAFPDLSDGTELLLTHEEYLTTEVTDGHPSAGSWERVSALLPNEIMMFGSYIFTPNSNGTIDVNRYTIDKTQLALFSSCPKFINVGYDYWLRDVVNAVRFAFVSAAGEASYGNASNTAKYFRPVFAIG